MPDRSTADTAGTAETVGTAAASDITRQVDALLDRWGDDIQNLRAAGIIYASDQIADLVAHGVDGVHLYSMNHPATTRRIWRNVEPLFTVE